MYVYLLYPARSSYISSEQGCAVTWCNISLSISLDGEYVIAQQSRQRWNKLGPSVMLKGPSVRLGPVFETDCRYSQLFN